MTKKRKSGSSEILCQAIVKGMQEKKADDILILDLRKISNAAADFFVICSGNSDKQLEAIADSVSEEVHKSTQEAPRHVEGMQNKEWVLMDYFNVVVHIFRKDRRTYFALEKLWGDAPVVEV
ncbi:MAG: ribosome silencing factor [Cyclobacteriaceae bacterium]|nr:ribosome silencing factor [Cyclobacteriaceae bacterium]MDW8330999.1 ribosome silencing factor [Cyclobacteriaceae bacterium]